MLYYRRYSTLSTLMGVSVRQPTRLAIYLATLPLYPPPLQGRGKDKKEGLRPSKTPCNVFGALPLLGSLFSGVFKREIGGKEGLRGAPAPIGWVGGKKEIG